MTDTGRITKTDGTGAELVDDALYYVMDARGCVGNCGLWWAPNGNGYVCSIDEAGVYAGRDVRSMRDTDVPWPVDYVLARTVRHVRVDNQAFARRDNASPREWEPPGGLRRPSKTYKNGRRAP